MAGSGTVEGTARAPRRGHTHDACARSERRRPEAHIELGIGEPVAFAEAIHAKSPSIATLVGMPGVLLLKGRSWLLLREEQQTPQSVRVVVNVRMMWW